jgi:8-oxo-dGTP pyrophosphatase MutT (NUDIX family)
MPFPAATVVLLRERSGDVETLLTKRHSASRFAGGDYVFPGGKVELDDMPPDAERFVPTIPPATAAQRLGAGLDARGALAYWVAAIREVFEEVGVLLAYTSPGSLVSFAGENHSRFRRHRDHCHAGNRAFFEMLRGEGLSLAADRLVHFAHWITPEENPIRFDTRFFAARMPCGQEAEADGREIVDVRWLTPREALEAFRRKEISLRVPTIKNLELLSEHRSLADLLSSLGTRQVTPIRPRILTVDGRPLAVLPGDPRWY